MSIAAPQADVDGKDLYERAISFLCAFEQERACANMAPMATSAQRKRRRSHHQRWRFKRAHGAKEGDEENAIRTNYGNLLAPSASH